MVRKAGSLLLLVGWAVATVAAGEGRELYRRVAPSSVQIVPAGSTQARGSGALIDLTHRLVLTADHVVRGLPDNPKGQVVVLFAQQEPDGAIITDLAHYRRRFADLAIGGRVVAQDRQRDLALIQLERLPPGVKALPLAEQDPAPGDLVHVVGMSSGQHGGAFGYCSGSVRNVFPWTRLGSPGPVHIVATQVPTNKGDSGGPVVNDRGALVAVVSSGTIGDSSNPSEWTYRQQVLDHSIHVREVRTVLNEYLRLTEATPAVRRWIGELRHPDPTLRLKAAWQLGTRGAAAAAALPALEEATRDDDADVRIVAASAIRRIREARAVPGGKSQGSFQERDR